MPFLSKPLPNGKYVGITNGEIVLPLSVLEDLSDEDIVKLVRELAQDLDFLKDYMGGGLDFSTIDEAKTYVKSLIQKDNSEKVKRELTQQRRKEFDFKRAQLMLALIDRDGYVCQHVDCENQEDLTIDHILPLSKGGSDELSNLQLLCRKHNSLKSGG